MTLELLLATMNYPGSSLLEKMRVSSDMFIMNQISPTGRTDDLASSYRSEEHQGHKIRILSITERGIGLSRETSLLRAQGDILLFSDDDVSYHEQYAEQVLAAFQKESRADLLFFRIGHSGSSGRPEPQQPRAKRARFYNSLRYGSINMAVKRQAVRAHNLHFNPLFGGSHYGSGEDTLFIVDCLKAGLRCYTTGIEIGQVDLSSSSWFTGYNEAYLRERGALFYHISSVFFWPLCCQFVLRHKNLFPANISLKRMLCLMVEGRREFKDSFLKRETL